MCILKIQHFFSGLLTIPKSKEIKKKLTKSAQICKDPQGILKDKT